MEITKEELINMIKEEALKLKQKTIQESEAVSASVNVYDVDMNSNDELGDSDKALAYKDPSKKVEKAGETAKLPKMNQKDGNEGSDKKAAVAVKVDAGSKKGGDSHTAGQAKANFTSKKDIQKEAPSAPFDDRVNDLKMNSEDKIVDKEAKTYVSAGAEKSGKTHTAGQAKAEVHERMPEKEAEEPTDPIAVGIEIDGSNVDLKESYTKSELKSFILSEANKAAKNYTETQIKDKKKAELEKELTLVMESLEECGVSMEEGIFGASKKEKEEMKKSLEAEIDKLLAANTDIESKWKDIILKQAEDSGYSGEVKAHKTSSGKYAGQPILHWSKPSTAGGFNTPGSW